MAPTNPQQKYSMFETYLKLFESKIRLEDKCHFKGIVYAIVKGYGRCIRSISISCVFSPLFQVARQVESWKLPVASCQARSILFKASYKLPGQVARQVASGKLTGQVGKLQVARSSCQQVGNLPAQVDKLPAMGGTGDHELNSGFFTTSCPAPCLI